MPCLHLAADDVDIPGGGLRTSGCDIDVTSSIDSAGFRSGLVERAIGLGCAAADTEIEADTTCLVCEVAVFDGLPNTL